MKTPANSISCLIMIMMVFILFANNNQAQSGNINTELDKRVKDFLTSNAGTGGYLNVPPSDGKLLHDIILKNNYKNALEIGTSTGISSVWIAWALSKTGGKLITVEIDETRHKQALKNFEQAGLSKYIDARLADAHELVPALKGPFDFVFSDADKGWNKNYFIAVDPKLIVNGCFTTHNVSSRGGYGGVSGYLSFLKSLSNYETTVDENGGGVAISYKKAEK